MNIFLEDIAIYQNILECMGIYYNTLQYSIVCQNLFQYFIIYSSIIHYNILFFLSNYNKPRLRGTRTPPLLYSMVIFLITLIFESYIFIRKTRRHPLRMVFLKRSHQIASFFTENVIFGGGTFGAHQIFLFLYQRMILFQNFYHELKNLYYFHVYKFYYIFLKIKIHYSFLLSN